MNPRHVGLRPVPPGSTIGVIAPECRAEADRLRAAGVVRLTVPSAALRDGGARGWRVEAGLQPAPPRNGQVTVLFGPRPDLIGWAATVEGRPSEDLLQRVRHFP